MRAFKASSSRKGALSSTGKSSLPMQSEDEKRVEAVTYSSEAEDDVVAAPCTPLGGWSGEDKSMKDGITAKQKLQSDGEHYSNGAQEHSHSHDSSRSSERSAVVLSPNAYHTPAPHRGVSASRLAPATLSEPSFTAGSANGTGAGTSKGPAMASAMVPADIGPFNAPTSNAASNSSLDPVRDSICAPLAGSSSDDLSETLEKLRLSTLEQDELLGEVPFIEGSPLEAIPHQSHCPVIHCRSFTTGASRLGTVTHHTDIPSPVR